MISLTARRLQVFVAIVESGSFAAAARQLGIAQPSVSAHVQSLERDTGARLFERQSGRQAILTEVGRSFLMHARELIERTAKLEEDVSTRTGAGAASISFACQRSLAHTVLRGPLADFAKLHREIRLSVRIAFQEEVTASVRMGAADLGCLMSNEEPAGLPSILIGKQRFVVFAAPDHPLVGRKGVDPSELGRQDFVGPVANSLFGQTQRKLLAGLGIERVNMVAEGTEFSVVRDLVAAGLGVGASLHASVAADVAEGRLALIDIDGPPLNLDVRLLINPQRRSARPVRAFIEFLREAAEKAAA